MADGLFARMLLAAHKEVGNTYKDMILADGLIYDSWMSSPFGELERQAYSCWPYICDTPLDGWNMADLTLIEHLVSDPHETLYVGAGSGRMIVFMESKGISCRGADISPASVELMARRGMVCDLMDGQAMTYADSQFKRVVVCGDGLLDSLSDPAAAVMEAARVASLRVVVTGYEIDPVETVPITWGMAWNGEEHEGTYCAHPIAKLEGLLVEAGMTLLLTKSFGEDGDPEPDGQSPFGTMYLIEARW